jgi:hypothetical protein
MVLFQFDCLELVVVEVLGVDANGLRLGGGLSIIFRLSGGLLLLHFFLRRRGIGCGGVGLVVLDLQQQSERGGREGETEER